MSIAVRLVLFLAAVAAAALSFTCNAIFWWRTFDGDPLAQIAWVAVSVTCGVFKCLLLLHLSHLGIKWRHAPGAVVLFALTLGFDVLSGLAYAGSTYKHAASEASVVAADRVRIEAEIAAAETRRAAISEARPLARLVADLAATEAGARGCDASRMHLDRCKAVAAARSAVADAKERDRLDEHLSALRRQLAASARAVASTDRPTNAAPIVALFAQFGAVVTEEQVALWLHFVFVAIVELGATAGLAIALAPRAVQSAPLPRIEVAPEPIAPRSGHPLADILAGLVAGSLAIPGISVAGREIRAPQRILADAAGLSTSSVNRQLRELADAGRLTIRAGKAGTRIVVAA